MNSESNWFGNKEGVPLRALASTEYWSKIALPRKSDGRGEGKKQKSLSSQH